MKDQESFWWYLTLESRMGTDEVLTSLAELSGSIGAEIQELPNCIRSRAFYRSDKDLGYWMKRLNEALEPWPGIRIVDMGKVENRQWHTDWKDAFPPLPVGRHLVVLAPWHRGSEPEGRLPLYIHPKSAFGTGYHESTQIVLELLEKHVTPGVEVADIGTGSGILSIAAVKLGATRSWARDIDPSVVVEVRENVALNGLTEEQIEVATGDLLKDFDHKVDLLVANILLEPLLGLLEDVHKVLRPGALAVFSGMVVRERDVFMEKMEKVGLEIVDEKTKGDWWGVVTQAKA